MSRALVYRTETSEAVVSDIPSHITPDSMTSIYLTVTWKVQQ